MTADDQRTMEIAVFVPSKDRNNRSFDRGPWVERFVKVFCDAFGGTFEATVKGYWMDPKRRRPQYEKTSRLASLADPERIEAALPEVIELAVEFGLDTDQHEVMLVVNDHRVMISRADMENQR